MARWRLTEPHYLNVPGTRWEQIMNDRSTGKPVRKVYEVPLFLHPEDPTCWTEKDARTGDGDVIVCYEGKGKPNDIAFLGNPTPGMLPLDEEAQQISAKFSKLWTPTTGTDEQAQMESFQQKLLNGLVDQMSMAQSAPPVAAGMEKFMEMMMAMMQTQTQILAAIAGKGVAPIVAADHAEFVKQAEALGEKPVVVEDEPLEEIEPTALELGAAIRDAEKREAVSLAKAEALASSRRI